MAALSELRGTYKFGNDLVSVPSSKRHSPLPPPPPLLVSAATTPTTTLGNIQQEHHNHNQYFGDDMFYNGLVANHQQSSAYLKRYQQELAAMLEHQSGVLSRSCGTTTSEEAGRDHDSNTDGAQAPRSQADTLLAPVKFNILGKMQILANNRSSKKGFKDRNPSGNRSQSSSDSCNTASPPVASGTGYLNSLEITPIPANPAKKKRGRKPKSVGPELTITKSSNTTTSSNNSIKRSAALESLKHKIQSNRAAAKREDTPLDFSRTGVEPDSRLRNILSMKSQVSEVGEGYAEAILNLSKSKSEQDFKIEMDQLPKYGSASNNKLSSSESRSASRSSSLNSSIGSLSPTTFSSKNVKNQSFGSQNNEEDTMDDDDDITDAGHLETKTTTTPTPQRGYNNLLPSPKLPTPGGLNVSPNGNGLPLNFGSFGNLFASPGGGMTPILGQTPVAPPMPLSIPPFDTSSPMFPAHMNMNAMSPTLPFDAGVTPVGSLNGNAGGGKIRATRPFKAYPKDPMTFSAVGLYGLPLGSSPGSTEAYLHQQSNLAYAEFRKQMLNQSHINRNRKQRSGDGLTSPNGLKDSHGSDDSRSGGEDSCKKTEQQLKDEAYWERRRKNNEAAKRSRDARRAKEDEIAIRAAFLEQENMKLRLELCNLKQDTAKLRCLLYGAT